MSPTRAITVGVDGSEGSRTALDLHWTKPVLRTASVRAVTVFDSLGAFGARYGIPIPMTDYEIAGKVEAQTQAMVDQALADWSARPEVRVAVRSGSECRLAGLATFVSSGHRLGRSRRRPRREGASEQARKDPGGQRRRAEHRCSAGM
jgi:hypothetical protein